MLGVADRDQADEPGAGAVLAVPLWAHEATVPNVQVPDHGGGRGGTAGPTGGPERSLRAGVQDPRRSADHADRAVPAEEFAGRTASALARAHGRDVAGWAAAVADSGRGQVRGAVADAAVQHAAWASRACGRSAGGATLAFERWIELDLEYIDRWSLWLDASILIRTVPAVLRGTGAT